MGSCCVAGLGLVWYCYCICMTFVCLSQKKWIYFGYLRGLGCVESKNKTSAKRKSTMSSLNPSIIQVDSFKCRADVPLAGNYVEEAIHVVFTGDKNLGFQLFLLCIFVCNK